MHHPARLSDDCYLSPQACFVTICTSHRQPLLVEPAVADDVTDQLLAQCQKSLVDVAAYCLMPDHLHALFVVESLHTDIRTCIARFKQFTGYTYAQRTDQRLWQASYFDYTLRSDEATLPTIAYIVNNPIRAQFVTLPEAWPFWGSSRWSRDELLDAVADCGGGLRPG